MLHLHIRHQILARKNAFFQYPLVTLEFGTQVYRVDMNAVYVPIRIRTIPYHDGVNKELHLMIHGIREVRHMHGLFFVLSREPGSSSSSYVQKARPTISPRKASFLSQNENRLTLAEIGIRVKLRPKKSGRSPTHVSTEPQYIFIRQPRDKWGYIPGMPVAWCGSGSNQLSMG